MVAMPQEMTTTSHLIWIKNRISEYDFVENQDFVVFNNFVKNPQNPKTTAVAQPKSTF